MIDLRTLDVVSDGVPFCRIDLTGVSDNLDVVADGTPWVGYQAAQAGIRFNPRWYLQSPLEAI